MGRKKRRGRQKEEIEGGYNYSCSEVEKMELQVPIAASIHVPVNCGKHLPGKGMDLE